MNIMFFTDMSHIKFYIYAAEHVRRPVTICVPSADRKSMISGIMQALARFIIFHCPFNVSNAAELTIIPATFTQSQWTNWREIIRISGYIPSEITIRCCDHEFWNEVFDSDKSDDSGLESS